MSASLLVVGAINTDLVATMDRPPDAGETITALGFATYGGGKGANQAVSAARNGASVVMLGACGDDDYGHARISDLALAGISTEWVRIDPERSSGVALIFVEAYGENRIAYVPGATLAVSKDHCIKAMIAVEPDVVLATNELPLGCLREVVRLARDAGATVILNATPDPIRAKSLLSLVDILIVNEIELRAMLDLEDVAEVSPVGVRGLIDKGPSTVVVTLGDRGALALTASNQHNVESPNVEVVDTTGAGDAFCGAFAASIARREHLEAALRYGVFAGSIATTIAGAQTSSPTREQIETMMAERR